MKIKLSLIAALALLVGVSVWLLVPTNKPITNQVEAITNTPSTGTNSVTAADAKPKPYPFDTCLVDGMKLGSMGEPYAFVYKGQEIKFCCANCKPQFDEDPDKFLKKIQDAETKK